MDSRLYQSKLFLPFLALLSLGFAGCNDRGSDAPPTAQAPSSLETRRLIVKFKSGGFGSVGAEWNTPGLTSPSQVMGPTSQQVRQMIRAEVGDSSNVSPIIANLYTVEVSGSRDLKEAEEKIRAIDEVEYVEPDHKVFAMYRPNDPELSQQWAHTNVQSERAWDLGRGDRNVLVGVIDTGVDYNHPDLKANIWTDPQDGSHGRNLINNSSDPMADDNPHYHGTHCAGIIGAVGDNSTGIIGQSPNVSIMGLKFLGADGSGSTSDAVKAIYYGISKGAKILSNSWGSNQFSQTLGDAIDRARQSGILFVVAAGNGGEDGVGDNNDSTPTYPANYTYDNVLSVAATDTSDRLTRFSNYGSGSVHVAAPGANIYSTMNGSRYQNMSGTSMATPQVAGLAALLMGKRPDLSYKEIKRVIMENVDVNSGLQGRLISNGRINAYRSMAAVSGVTPSPTPSPSPSPFPSPSPSPWPSPTPTDPVGGIANPILLAGQTDLVVRDPNTLIVMSYDVNGFLGAYGVYIEVSRPNMQFMIPNGNTADPYRLTWGSFVGLSGQLSVLPVRDLPGWGAYQMRVIPLNQTGMPVGLFSNASTLRLQPN